MLYIGTSKLSKNADLNPNTPYHCSSHLSFCCKCSDSICRRNIAGILISTSDFQATNQRPGFFLSLSNTPLKLRAKQSSFAFKTGTGFLPSELNCCYLKQSKMQLPFPQPYQLYHADGNRHSFLSVKEEDVTRRHTGSRFVE